MSATRSQAQPSPEQPARRRGRATLSLKGRALRYLAAREHSRVELARKLAPHAESEQALAAVLDALQDAGYLSLERFAQSVGHRLGARFGVRRIEHELRAHQVDEVSAQAVLGDLRALEHTRAHAVWQRRFGEVATDPRGYAQQYRFLAQRGFTQRVIQSVLRAAAPEWAGVPDAEDTVD